MSKTKNSFKRQKINLLLVVLYFWHFVCSSVYSLFFIHLWRSYRIKCWKKLRKYFVVVFFIFKTFLYNKLVSLSYLFKYFGAFFQESMMNWFIKLTFSWMFARINRSLSIKNCIVAFQCDYVRYRATYCHLLTPLGIKDILTCELQTLTQQLSTYLVKAFPSKCLLNCI